MAIQCTIVQGVRRASQVGRGIVANRAIVVVGRLDAAEAEPPDYGFLPPQRRIRPTPESKQPSRPEARGPASPARRTTIPTISPPTAGELRRWHELVLSLSAGLFPGSLPADADAQ